MENYISLVPHSSITPSFINKVVELIKSKTSYFDYFSEDIYKEKVLCGHYLLWVCRNGVVVGRTVKHETGLLCLYIDAASFGKFDGSFNKVMEYIEEGARKSNYDRVIIEGRKGWERILNGYSHHSSAIFKEL